MPTTTLRELMEHEIDRWSYMTERQLQTRISRMRKPEKMACCYVVASQRGRTALMSQVETQILRASGRPVSEWGSLIRAAAEMYRTHHFMGTPEEMDRVRGETRRTTSGLPNAQVVSRYRDPDTGRHVASVDLVAAARGEEVAEPAYETRERVDRHGRVIREVVNVPDDSGFPPDLHDKETCTCAMCRALRRSRETSLRDSLIKEVGKQIRAIKEDAPRPGRRIRFKRRTAAFRDGWKQPLLGG